VNVENFDMYNKCSLNIEIGPTVLTMYRLLLKSQENDNQIYWCRVVLGMWPLDTFGSTAPPLSIFPLPVSSTLYLCFSFSSPILREEAKV